MPEESRTTLLTEIKLLLQEELGDVREAMNEIKLEFASLRGDTIARAEFQKVLVVPGSFGMRVQSQPFR